MCHDGNSHNQQRQLNLHSVVTTNYCEAFIRNTIFVFIQVKKFKIVLYNIDVTAMCSVANCKQSCLIDHLLHS